MTIPTPILSTYTNTLLIIIVIISIRFPFISMRMKFTKINILDSVLNYH